jgi:uncharacterized protein
MNAGAQVRMLDDRRLHLHHGPIDLIIEAFGRDWQRALKAAEVRFDSILNELVAELPLLRTPLGDVRPKGAVAQRMAAAVKPFSDMFVTPMAAVAGSVADEVLAAMCAACALEKAYVNNGGDIAFWLTKGRDLTAAIHSGCDAGRVRLGWDQTGRGLASSGWRGRSYSLGIADAVTVVAANAAMADAAATLIANAVDLPGHPAVLRAPACDLSPDSDLGMRWGLAASGRGAGFSGRKAGCGTDAGAGLHQRGGFVSGGRGGHAGWLGFDKRGRGCTTSDCVRPCCL